MAWLGAAITGASSIASSVLGGSKEPTPTLEPLYEDAGWTGDKGGSTTAPVPPSFPKANEFLGSNIGKAIAGVGGGFLDDYRGLRNTKKNHAFLKSKGLNSWEIASGGSGGPVQAQGNTLGSGPATQVQSQQNFAAGQAQLDRENKKEVAKITSQAGRTTAETGIRSQELKEQIAPLQQDKMKADTRLTNQSYKRSVFDLENAWRMKFAGMSMENGMFALAAFNKGIDFRAVLYGEGTEQQRKDAEDLFNLMIKISGPGKYAISTMEFWKQIVGGEGTMTEGKGFLEAMPDGGPTGRLKRDPRTREGAYGGKPFRGKPTTEWDEWMKPKR